MKIEFLIGIFLTVSYACLAQENGQTAIKFISDKIVPIYLVEEYTPGGENEKADTSKYKFEIVAGEKIMPIDKLSKLTLLGYTPLEVNLSSGVHTIQANYGEKEIPLTFKINVDGKPQIWKIYPQSDVLLGTFGAMALVSLVATILSFQPAVNEWNGGKFSTNSIVLTSSVGGLLLSLGLTSLANPTAHLEQ